MNGRLAGDNRRTRSKSTRLARAAMVLPACAASAAHPRVSWSCAAVQAIRSGWVGSSTSPWTTSSIVVPTLMVSVSIASSAALVSGVAPSRARR